MPFKGVEPRAVLKAGKHDHLVTARSSNALVALIKRHRRHILGMMPKGKQLPGLRNVPQQDRVVAERGRQSAGLREGDDGGEIGAMRIGPAYWRRPVGVPVGEVQGAAERRQGKHFSRGVHAGRCVAGDALGRDFSSLRQ